MRFFNTLKTLYSGSNSLFNHIALFSMIGIFVILLNNVVSFLGYNIYLLDLIAIPPSSKIELWLDIFFGTILFIYIFGYCYTYSHFLQQKSDTFNIPEIDFLPIFIGCKMLPLFSFWLVLYLLVLLSGLFAFPVTTIKFGVFIFVMLLITPFPVRTLISFSKDFKYHMVYFNPWSVYCIGFKRFVKVLLYSLRLLMLIAFIVVIMYLGFILTKTIENLVVKLSVYLIGLCFGAYVLMILNLLFFSDVTRLVESSSTDIKPE